MYDNFARSTYGSTLFHELNFLGYHKNKLDILSYYILKKNENVGVFSVVKILEKDSIYILNHLTGLLTVEYFSKKN